MSALAIMWPRRKTVLAQALKLVLHPHSWSACPSAGVFLHCKDSNRRFVRAIFQLHLLAARLVAGIMPGYLTSATMLISLGSL